MSLPVWKAALADNRAPFGGGLAYETFASLTPIIDHTRNNDCKMQVQTGLAHGAESESARAVTK
jgi:hypothetical protein